MITSLRMQDFKSFADETLRVGPFTVIVGANASGKSNIRDAFRFLHGVGRGYGLADILGKKYGIGGQVEWKQIRGAPNEVSRLQQVAELSYHGFLLETCATLGARELSYSIGVESGVNTSDGFRVIEEELVENGATIYTSHPGKHDPIHAQGDDTHLLLRMSKVGRQKKWGDRIAVRLTQPALTQIDEHRRIRRSHKEGAERMIRALGGMRFLDLIPDRMRKPAFPGQIVLGDSGENLPTVLQKICSDQRRKENLIDWTRELTPMDVVDFEFQVDLGGHVQLVICEKGERKLSAYSVSDGTLRFLAMLAALLSEDAAGLYFFEEIENGIHPSRLHLLLDLIERRTAEGKVQVVATTHSPALLAMMSDKGFANASVVCRLPDTSDAIIRPISELHNAEKLRRSQGLDTLHACGWMEDALALTGGKGRAA